MRRSSSTDEARQVPAARRRARAAAWVVVVAAIVVGGGWFGRERLGGTPSAAQDYVLAFRDLPDDVRATIEACGGTIRAVLEPIGAVRVTGDASLVASVAAKAGPVTAFRDVTIAWVADCPRVELADEHLTGDEAYLSMYQWDLFAIDAPGAWHAGYTGAGVRVAVLDTGIDPVHPDLAANLNVKLSVSLVPHEPFLDDRNGHGTHVAGIIAALDNQIGVVGVAPGAEIVAIKILDGDGRGELGALVQGIVRAVAIGADVIDLSFGAYVSPDGTFHTGTEDVRLDASEAAAFLELVARAVDYAIRQGVFVVAAAGDGAPSGANGSVWTHVPSDLGCVTVSATGPVGWTPDREVDCDRLASYSGFGDSIDLAAPGGSGLVVGSAAHLDEILNCTDGQWYAWYAGTGQAAAHVAGVAALLLEKRAGTEPDELLRSLRRTADDRGDPGWDPLYGDGRVNAARAVGP